YHARPKALHLADELVEFCLAKYQHTKPPRPVQFAARLLSCHDVIGFLGNGPRRLTAQALDQAFNLFTAVTGQGSRDHERLPAQLRATRFSWSRPRFFGQLYAQAAQLFNGLSACIALEEAVNAVGS